MRNFIISVCVIIIGLGAGQYVRTHDTPTLYESKVETKEVPVAVDALDARIKAAVASSSIETETRAKNAYNTAKRAAEVEVELVVRAEYKKELEKKEKELQKESVAY